ncbi:MAG TPA: hypothetical protein VK961_27755 [Chthoniobacter sp.]|nr:hypothetical protein [Chthoniobacter sp.]
MLPISFAIGQTSTTGDAASGDDLTKRLEWLRAQVGKSADGKATPAPGAPKKFSDTRTLSLRGAELHSSDPAVAKSTPAPAQKTIAQAPAATPAPAKEKSADSKLKKTSVADRSTPALTEQGSKSSKTDGSSKVAQAPATTPTPSKERSADTKSKKTSIADRSTSATPAPVAQGPKSSKVDGNPRVAQAPATTPAPSKEKTAESKSKKTSIAENSTNTTPAPATSKSTKADANAKVAQAPATTPAPAKEKASDSKSKKTAAIAVTTATPSPTPAASKSSKTDPTSKIARAVPTPTPAPATPAPSRVATAKATPTPARRSETLSLDTRFTDLRSSSLSQPSRSISAIGSSSAAYGRMANSPMANYSSSSVSGRYPWKTSIVTTVFWIGEPVSGRNFTPNVASSWDPIWTRNYGGYDNPNPEARRNFVPANFIPRQNPFYVALPYNDVTRGTTKPEARVVIPWFREAYRKEGQSVCRDRWIAVRSRTGRVAYAQWSDCGPFRTDHWQYVFGMERPKPNLNQGAGLDVSPAMRDYLGLQSTDVTDWKFVEAREVPNGPWALYGENNTFVQRGRFMKASTKADLPEVASRTR